MEDKRNDNQDRNISELWRQTRKLTGAVSQLRTIVIGIDANNGLRGTVRELYRYTHEHAGVFFKRISAIEQQVSNLPTRTDIEDVQKIVNGRCDMMQSEFISTAQELRGLIAEERKEREQRTNERSRYSVTTAISVIGVALSALALIILAVNSFIV